MFPILKTEYFYLWFLAGAGSSSLKRGDHTSNKTVGDGEHRAKLVSEKGCRGATPPPQFFLRDLALRLSILSAQNSKLLLNM